MVGAPSGSHSCRNVSAKNPRGSFHSVGSTITMPSMTVLGITSATSVAPEQPAVAALVEEQRAGVGGETEVQYPAQHDHVVARLDDRLERAVEERVDVLEDRAAGADAPRHLGEAVGATGREDLRDRLL